MTDNTTKKENVRVLSDVVKALNDLAYWLQVCSENLRMPPYSTPRLYLNLCLSGDALDKERAKMVFEAIQQSMKNIATSVEYQKGSLGIGVEYKIGDYLEFIVGIDPTLVGSFTKEISTQPVEVTKVTLPDGKIQILDTRVL